MDLLELQAKVSEAVDALAADEIHHSQCTMRIIKAFDQFRQAAVSGSLPPDTIKEAKFLLLIDGEGFCKEWKEGIGDCQKPSCVFCRKQKLINTLERQ